MVGESMILSEPDDTHLTVLIRIHNCWNYSGRSLRAKAFLFGSPTFRKKQMDIIPVSPEYKPMKTTIEVRV